MQLGIQYLSGLWYFFWRILICRHDIKNSGFCIQKLFFWGGGFSKKFSCFQTVQISIYLVIELSYRCSTYLHFSDGQLVSEIGFLPNFEDFFKILARCAFGAAVLNFEKSSKIGKKFRKNQNSVNRSITKPKSSEDMYGSSILVT